MKKINIIFSLLFLIVNWVGASSHREAPLIANDPLADNTDLYAFRSPDNPDMITIIACYVPFQLPQGGPNYYGFGENIRYEIHIDNNTATEGDDIIYRFTFTKENEDPTTFFNIRLGAENLKTTYTLQKSMDGGMTFTTVIENGTVPPNNIGQRSIEGAAGLNTTYEQLMMGAITQANSGEQVFCGPTEDPFFVDLGGIFDLGDAPRQNGEPVDGTGCLNISTIAIQVPISMLQKDGQPVSEAANILDSDYIIGVWASASRQQIRTFNTETYEEEFSGDWVQVSRIGMPLTNEAVIPIGVKDLWNATTPYQDLANLDVFGNFFYNPELALYMDDDQFGGAVPAFAPLRVQRNSLQAFDFGVGQDGLFGLKGSDAVEGTALDDDIFGELLLPRAGAPRSVDLWPIFHTGVPNLRPYQLATGKGGDPLAEGKPFINNFLPNGGDMLRLNMAVPPTPRDDENFSNLGIVQAAVLGLTNPAYNDNSELEFIPNMDGFPNGRRLEDDVTRIELQAVSGIALAAIGLFYDDYTAGDPNPVTEQLLNVLTYDTGVNENDTTFRASFPYVQTPWSGTGKCSGEIVNYEQPDILPPTVTVNAPVAICKRIVRVNINDDKVAILEPADVDAGSMADAGIQSLTLNQTAFDCDDVRAYNTITLTVTDSTGAADSCTAIVRVLDESPLPARYETASIGASKGSSSISACRGAIMVNSTKTGNPRDGKQDWNQFTGTTINGDFTLNVRVINPTRNSIVGVMVRTSQRTDAKMVYAGVPVFRENTVEVGFRDDEDTMIPTTRELGKTGEMFTVERRGRTIRIFNGSTLLVTKSFRAQELQVGFFATARNGFEATGIFSNITLSEANPSQNSSAASSSMFNANVDARMEASVWPNPASETLNIQFMEDSRNVTINISDLLGRVIMSREIDQIYANDRIQMELNKDMSDGTYILTIQSDDAAPFSKEFIKRN